MKQQRVAILALAAFAMACADLPVGPSRTLLPEAASLAVIQNKIDFRAQPPQSYPAGIQDGYVVLCKTGDAAGTFNFSVTVNGGAAFNVTRTLSGPGATDCGTGPIFTSAVGGNGAPDLLVITETAQANWAVTNIDIVQHLALFLFNQGGYTAPRLNDSFNTTNRVANVYVNGDMARTVTFTNDYTPPPPPPGGGEGCTPGYWKQPQHFDSWPAGYTPGMSFNSALNLPGTNLFPASFTMLQALGANGGGKNALARHAAAAILNAASSGVDYDLTVAQVQAEVLAAYNNGNLIEAKKNLLAVLNEQGCPLN